MIQQRTRHFVAKSLEELEPVIKTLLSRPNNPLKCDNIQILLYPMINNYEW